ncbi:MAG: YjbQ family protein [bacterium]|nr:YjbQ family protein [bacterium]
MRTLPVKTAARQQIIDVTAEVAACVQESGIADGVCHLFVPHTTAGVTINENADPDVKHDILLALDKLIIDDPQFRHMEGNSAAHLKTLITGSSLTLFVNNGRLELGSWGGIYFCEYDGPRSRRLLVRTQGANGTNNTSSD